jgi:hypothetical protein
MKWYTACLVFEVKNHHQSNCSFYEESWIILHADTPEDAKSKAQKTGTEREESFMNSKGDLVSWNFLGFRQIREFSLNNDGEELISISSQQAGFIENMSKTTQQN